ncbi:MAG: TAT-variant-translocated molybdopterin oxidoreductase [Pyrinomonadaceae bacterium]
MPSQDSKQDFKSLRDKILSQNGKQYWRSVEEYVDAPEFEEFVKQEYPQHAEEWHDGVSRRNFVKIMGASLALAGISGCVIQPAEQIVPYVTPQEGMLPGKPNYFATSMSIGGVATGLLAKSFEGRPVKIEGNPDHPGSRGGTDVLAQASLLDMYDPDRSQEIRFRGTSKAWPNFVTEFRAAIDENRKDGGAGIRFLSQTVTSPALIEQFKQISSELPGARWIQYEPVNQDNAMAGAKMAFGAPVQAVYDFEKADRILSLDADIFSGFNVGYIKQFAKRRAFEGGNTVNRLYAVETTVTLTGAKADHRIAVKPSSMSEAAEAMAAALGVSGAVSSYTDNGPWIAAMAKDLTANRGKSLVIAGDQQPPMVHALAHAMNAALGNVGQTVKYIEPSFTGSDRSQVDQLRELMADIDGGRVKMLVILGGNPVYNTPADLRLNLDRVNNKVSLRIHVGTHFDETAEICHWHIPEKHYLESWGDSRAYDGTVSVTQPLISPLYEGRSVYEVVQLFSKENFEKSDQDIVKEYWQKQNISPAASQATVVAGSNSDNQPTPVDVPPMAQTATTGFDDKWRKSVHDGFIPNTAAAQKSVSANTAFLGQPSPIPVVSGGLEISILPDPSIYDGRFANNGWLQELPNPLNKVTWENVALISPKTARKLGINQGNDADERSGGERGTTFVNTRGGNMYSDLVTLKYAGGEISKPVPMWIAPGQPEDVVTIFMGYGRTRAGRVGTGLGYNAFDVRRSDSMNFGTGDILKTGEQTSIASTQIHFNMEGRDLLRVFDLDEFMHDEHLGDQEDFYPKSMYPYEQHQETYNKHHKWGMTIDLNSCVGCNACVLACQSENNIPIVGKTEIERSREMHWMRVDAYYGGEDIDHPDGPNFQPVLCQQCEQAPCEVVCPVHATVHSAEGLNDMVYNRCVGTRYCSNNCPYKVRRFNFMLYQDWDTPQYKLMRNPEVSVRSRGVMEKCTYCTQRIAAGRIEAEKAGRPIADGEIVTACQSVCPADAITFGDMNDPNSRVAKTKKDRRDYNLLNELNTQPRTTYLAGLKNQNKEMPDYKMSKSKGHGGESH